MLRITLPLAVAVALLAAGPPAAHADVSPIPAVRPLLNVPRARIAPLVDASPNDPAWASAAVIASLVPAMGSAADTAAPPTRIQLLWDSDYLYLRFAVDGRLIPYGFAHGKKADISSDDCVGVVIDSRGIASDWISILATPAGDLRDEQFRLSVKAVSNGAFKLVDDMSAQMKRTVGENSSGLRHAVRTTPSGWLVDLAIPATVIIGTLNQTQFAQSTTLRANFLRYEYTPTADGVQRTAADWAPVGAGDEMMSPEGMGFLKLVGSP